MADTFISSGVSSDGIVLTGERLYIENGGEAVNTTVNEGGRMYVSSGGKANNTTLNASGRVNVSSGGTATVTTVNSGGVVSLAGGTASGITVNESGIVYVSSGGKAAAAEFQSGGSMYVYAKGEVNTAIVNSGGFLEVSSGGTASGVEVLEGGGFRFAVAPGTCVQGTHTGSAFEMKDGRISGYTVTSGGWLHVLKGGVADNATVQSNGVVWVSSGGRLAGATLCEGGRVTVSSGGIAENTLVSSGGRIQVSSGGILTGSMSIANGGSVSAYEGAILDFDLTRVSAEAPALVNDLSLVKGAPACTLTVSASQASGTYKLADGAAEFTGTITIQNTYGDSFGTFTVGQTVYAGDSRFTLNLTDGTLSVTVNGPTVTDESGDVLLANAMPQAEYMYGCCPTAVAMLLGYYDLYGYRGKDFSALIEGDVALESRGTDGDIYNMNAFDTVLGRATATEDYVYRFFSRTDIGDIVADIDAAVPTTPEEELEYSFVNNGAGPDLRTDVWNCLADYLGTGQIWRGNDNLSTGYRDNMLEQVLNDEDTLTIVSGDIARTIKTRYEDFLYGLYLYVQSRDYAMDMKVTATNFVDVNGGDFTFEDYKKEIDAGRPVLIMIEEHVMTGYGYNAGTKEIIFDDCYEAGQRMVWDGVYNYAGEDRRLEAVATIGFMATDADIDLAVAAIDGAAEKLILSTEEDTLVSADYIFAGSPLYLSFAAANLGKSPSGSFDAGISIDDEQKERVSPISLSGESVMNLRNIPIAAELGVGLHSFVIALDPDAAIQEQAARNNVEQRSLMVLKEGTNVVNGTKTVASGEVSSDDYVMNGAGIVVQDGGTADGTIIQGKVTNRAANGEVTFVPGIVNVAQGGLVRDAEVYEYGQLQVSGTAENILVYENGYAALFDGGTVSGISVDGTATLLVESGGVLTGLIQLDQDAEVSFEDGAALNFDLTQVKAGGEALVNDLSVIKGTPLYTLTVSGTQAGGTYTLADGAAALDGTITVKNTLGESLGALAAGETLSVGGTGYTLNLTDETLSVTVVTAAGPDDAPTNPTGTAEKVSWDATGTGPYVVEYSTDGFEHVVSVVTAGTAIDTPELPAGTYQWRVKTESGSDWAVGNAIVSEAGSDAPKAVRSNADGNEDLFFATPDGTWGYLYYARHTGSINDWTGTNEMVSANGRGRIRNLFFGSADPNVLCLTDGVNGDALFVDDVYTDLPEEIEAQTARLYKIREIRAGAGDDIVDMTSQQFEYVGEGLTIRGGDGDDVIWANKGANRLFGDAGNDRIAGASGDDMIAGGIGDDRMHGGGGNDTFTFCENWGTDTVEQLATGTVTLWFLSGSMENWNAGTLTYADGENSVSVSGVTADRITLNFGDDGSGQFAGLSAMGAFADFSSKRVFGESANGILASV